MAKISGKTKEARKERVRLTIRRHNGIREKELVEVVGVEQRTLNNYLRELEEEGKLYKQGVLWFENDHAKLELKRFPLSAEETLTLYLLVRLFVKQTDKRHEIADQLLVRLAEILKDDDVVQSDILEAAEELAHRKERKGFLKTLRTVLQSYLYRRRVEVDYKPLHGKPFTTELEIYLIEPSGFGYSTYLIGYSQLHSKVWTLKLERVLSAKRLDVEYTIPDDFPGLTYLRNAWSVFTGEDTQRIRLRFSERAKRRVLESDWHFSQGYLEEGDGSLLWWVDVADTTDIAPWIRGWGSDVEVLEPRALREDVMRHLRLSAENYNLQPPPERHPYQWLYAKTNRKNRDEIHLLIYHLIDVGQVTHALWNNVLTQSFQQQIAALLQLTTKQAGRWIAFIAGLHDLGKASPAYQHKYAPPWLKKKLKANGLNIDLSLYNASTQTVPHATVTTWALPQPLKDYCEYDIAFAQKVSVALGGHHGKWPLLPEAIERIDERPCELWDDVRRDLLWELRAIFQPPTPTVDLSHRELNTLLSLISGLTSVADWIGSNVDYFPFEQGVKTGRAYAEISAEYAKSALHDLGWIGWRPTGKQSRFTETFEYLKFDKPRPIQEEVIAHAEAMPAASLMILEAPTGIGKTEIALHLANNWLQRHGGRGIYIAMPTQATSNQMYGRTIDFLAHQYPDMLINTPLLHGQAAYDEQVEEIRLNRVGESEAAGVVAMGWFMKKSKQALLAPFGVGTVDQALLSILQTNHFFVRLFALSHKVVIFDEVHAYDTYMSTLFERLLGWLNAIGTSVIILSATLPSTTRQRLIQAYRGEKIVDIQSESAKKYPALTLTHETMPAQTLRLKSEVDSVTLEVAWLDSAEPKTILDRLQLELADGGCAAVICNTVKRAQDVYRLLYTAFEQGELDISAENLLLFHARFPPVWRKEIEKRVLKLFGKPDREGKDFRPKRPQRAIVVATQVIEQSLDLDFDVMITDLAPIDLLLQRAGRLHRHNDRNPRPHPRQLIIIRPELQDGLPTFGVNALIYEPFLLLGTYRQLMMLEQINLPTQTPDLIEAVYTDKGQDKDDVWRNALIDAHQQMKADERAATNKAKRPLIRDVNSRRLLKQQMLGLEEDDPSVHQAFQAKTRDIAASLMLVCLFRSDTGVSLHPDGRDRFMLTSSLFPERVKALLQNTISVTNWVLVNRFSAEKTDWPQHPILRHARTIIFDNGKHRFEYKDSQYELTLDRTYGLQLTNLSEEEK